MGYKHNVTGPRGRFDFGFFPQWFKYEKDGSRVCRTHGRDHLVGCQWCRAVRCAACWGQLRCDHCQHDITDPSRYERKRETLRRLRRRKRRDNRG